MIGNGRTLQEDTVLLGYKVPKGVSASDSQNTKPFLSCLLLGPSSVSNSGNWQHAGIRLRRRRIHPRTLDEERKRQLQAPPLRLPTLRLWRQDVSG